MTILKRRKLLEAWCLKFDRLSILLFTMANGSEMKRMESLRKSARLAWMSEIFPQTLPPAFTYRPPSLRGQKVIPSSACSRRVIWKYSM